jgi:hypothetical protein
MRGLARATSQFAVSGKDECERNTAEEQTQQQSGRENRSRNSAWLGTLQPLVLLHFNS